MKTDESTKFKKKVYHRLDRSPLSGSISLSRLEPNSEVKKIIPSGATKGVREEFKKTFLPLLIDIFELRQTIENHKSRLQSDHPFPIGNVSKSPQEILQRLEELQTDIEEAQRWCDGVILQIAKGIEEARETLKLINGEKQKNFFKKLIGLIKR